MRTLFITNHYLDNNSGGSFASRAFANAFAELSEECVLIYPDQGVSIREYVHPRFKLISTVDTRNKLKKLIDLYLGRIHRYKKGKIIAAINSLNPDLVVFDNSRCSSGLIAPIKNMGIKVITIHHNYEIEYYKGSPPSLLWRYIFMYYMKKTERDAVIQSSLNLTLTKEDAHLLKLHYAKKLEIKIESIGCFESKKSELPVLKYNKNNVKLNFIITGSLAAFQTETTLIPFLEEIYPKLITKYPNSELIIAGRNPSDHIINICNKYPSVKLIENPLNMHDIIENADIYICPISIGGGLKLRIMDGLKGGLPVISHKVASRGYEAFYNNGFMVTYSDKETFFKELQILIDKRHQYSRDYIQLCYKDNFSYQSGIKRLNKILKISFNII